VLYRFVAVFTINAKSTTTVQSSLAEIGAIVGVESSPEAVKGWLSRREKPWLLIIDGLDDENLDLSQLLPQSQAAYVLITTRNGNFEGLDNTKSVILRGLDPQDAKNLFQKVRAHVSDYSIKGTKQVTEMMGYTPTSLIDNLKQIENPDQVCLAMGFFPAAIVRLKHYILYDGVWVNSIEYRPAYYSLNIDTLAIGNDLFKPSWDCLVTEHSMAAQDAIELMYLILAYNDAHFLIDMFSQAIKNRQRSLPNQTEDSLLTKLSSNLSKMFQAREPVPKFLSDNLVKLDSGRIEQALYKLRSVSLIDWDGKTEYFAVVPVVKRWLSSSLDKKTKDFWLRSSENTFVASIGILPEDFGDQLSQFRSRMIPFFAHFYDYLSIITNLENFVTYKDTIYKRSSDPHKEICDAAKVCFFKIEQHMRNDKIRYLAMGAEVLEHLHGSEDSRTLAAKIATAAICAQHGTPWGTSQAIKQQREVILGFFKLGPISSRNLMLAKSNLARLLSQNEEHEEALQLQEETLDTIKSSFGPEHKYTIDAMDQLGSILICSGRLEQGIVMYRSVLAIQEKAAGCKDPKTLAIKRNLALALAKANYLDEALQLSLFVLEAREQTLGEEHTWTAQSRSEVYEINLKLGNPEAATERSWLISALKGIPFFDPSSDDVFRFASSSTYQESRAAWVQHAQAQTPESLIESFIPKYTLELVADDKHHLVEIYLKIFWLSQRYNLVSTPMKRKYELWDLLEKKKK
jgi:tetratricopeptide (TPR) repeat protein